ncbi:snf1-related protein kinase catalytic subunit alpha kin10-like [Stylonychia lemnae]|uniref:Snf1-related protein kinase catalytic subunit alpha kin10-like n=1 Tax=Stylonychia lemnae TaxID=5949 RepID=A0A078AHI2_STYLE|nr:snf1-related protein kinase catalytic subunit alpha kin10-like [Stylonychia lemnae]|eukprot:CDW81311.1 snf1-related protein kinase catalytic subunit alpha kin10-like [Stylonychia lemnae]
MSFDLKIGNYNFLKTLGIGTFGKVKSKHCLTGHEVAIKIMNKKKIKQQNVFEKVKREIKVLRYFNHPHIIKHFEFIDTPSDIFMVIEYAAGGELFDYISRREKYPIKMPSRILNNIVQLSEAEARNFFWQMYSAMFYVHVSKIAHRDLKPENLLLDSTQRNLKLIDFGLSNSMKDSQSLKTACGSPNYASPEIVSGRTYGGVESDIWSMGVILYAMVCGSLPFDDESVTQLFIKIKEGRYSMPNFISDDLKDLINKMMQPNPIKRCTMREIRDHLWFQQESVPSYLRMWEQDLDQKQHQVDSAIVDQLFKIPGLELDVLKPDDVTQQVKDKKNNSITGIYELLNHDKIKQQCVELKEIQKPAFFKSKAKLENPSENSQRLGQKQQERLDQIFKRFKSGQTSVRRLQIQNESLIDSSGQKIKRLTQRMDSNLSAQTHFTDRVSDLSQNLRDLQRSLKAIQLESQQFFGAPKWSFGIKISGDLQSIVMLVCEKLKEIDVEWEFIKREKKFKCKTILNDDLFHDIPDYFKEDLQSQKTYLKFYLSIYKNPLNDSSQGDYFLLDLNYFKGLPSVFLDISQTFITLIKGECEQTTEDLYHYDKAYVEPSPQYEGKGFRVSERYTLGKFRKCTYDAVNYMNLMTNE